MWTTKSVFFVNTQTVYRGSAVGVPWECSGSAVGVPWGCRGSAVGEHGNVWDRPVAILLQCRLALGTVLWLSCDSAG